MIDYSQSGEQKIILDYFKGFRGVLCDIGANDGVTFSNSRALIELGWSGVLVEPSRTAFSKMHEVLNYSPATIFDGVVALDIQPNRHLKLVNAAITTQDGPIDFWDSGTHLRKGDTSLLSTTIPSTMARWKTTGEQFTKTTVRGITFATLLKETGVSKFDMITIDAEGADYDILSQIDLKSVHCKCLCIEHNLKNQQKFANYVSRFGMRLRWRSPINLIFCI